ncbi:unnamed protein product [Sphagnum jensenii]|uniref:TF-B3 domain-containing protein n=1 Tax=Sphagnum jensenii TaxID=128206 RepID=A0ABP1BM64_9BRYO
MPASSVLRMNAPDINRQLPAAPRGTWSTMTAETAGTNSRLEALADAAAVELQPLQQSPSITSYMEALQAASGMQPSRNRSCEVPALDQSKSSSQQTVRAPTFTELVVQASSCVEEIRHDLQHDVAIIPPKHAPKRYKKSSCAEKLLNHQTLAPAFREGDQAHAIASKRSGKAVYRKQMQQVQTDHEEPNLELRLGNGHLHNADVQGRTFRHSRAKELQLQRAAAAAAPYPVSCHIPVEAPRRSPNEFQYRVESRAGMLQQGASAFSRPAAAAAPPPIIGSTITMLPVSTTAAAQEDLRLAEPHRGAAQLEALKDDARAAALLSYRQQLMTQSASSSSEMPIVLPLVPSTTITATESYKGPPHQKCSAATTTIRNPTIIGHPRSAVMGTMSPHRQMMLSAMGPPPVPAIMGPTASLPSSGISTPFPLGRSLPSLPGNLSLSAPPHAGQQEEVANCTALVQIRGRSRNAPAVAAATAVVVGKVPDFWVTLTKFAVDWSDAGNHNQQQQAQLVLPEIISKHLPKEAVILILRAKVAVDGHNNSASSSQSDVGAAGAVAQHREPLDWPVIWRPTAWTPSICDGWSHFVKDGKLAVGDFCRFHQNSLDRNLFEVEITRPITL